MNTPQCKLQTFLQPPPLSRNKTHILTYEARLSRTKTQILSVHPESFCLSNLPTDTHADRQYHTKWEDYFLFMLHVVNLLTWTANRGNLPSCSCVLRETLETADCITLTFSSVTEKSQPLRGKEMRQSQAKPKLFATTTSHWLKDTDKKLRYHLWATSLEINTATYSTSRASTKAISYSTFDTRFWQQQKKTPFNFRAVWTIDFTATILTLSPPPPVLLIFQSPGIDTQLLSHSVDNKQKCFVFDLNLIILVHSNASQVASHGFILTGLGQDKFAPLVT